MCFMYDLFQSTPAQGHNGFGWDYVEVSSYFISIRAPHSVRAFVPLAKRRVVQRSVQGYRARRRDFNLCSAQHPSVRGAHEAARCSAFGRCIFCVKWMMVFQSTLPMKRIIIYNTAMLFTERRARHAFGRCIFCVKWMMVFQSTLLMKKTTIRAARTPMSGALSIHAFRENHVMAYTAASFAAPRSSGKCDFNPRSPRRFPGLQRSPLRAPDFPQHSQRRRGQRVKQQRIERRAYRALKRHAREEFLGQHSNHRVGRGIEQP